MSNYNNIFKDCQIEVEDKFLPRKKQSLILSEAYRALGEARRSFRVENCGTFLEYHLSEEEVKLNKANFCKDRLCPLCNWRRSKKIFAQVSSIMDVLDESDYRFLFLTLTIRNCEFHELENAISALIDGWRKLYRSKAFKNVVEGSFRTVEITVNREACTFHPHLHVILAVRKSYFHKDFIPQEKWSEMWQNACDLDYIPVVDIRAVKSGKLDVTEGNTKSFKSAIKEVSKYVAKGSDYLDGEFEEVLLRVSHLIEALAGRRLCSMTGVFKTVARELKLDDMEDGDLVHTETEVRPDLSYMIVRYHWRSGFYESEVVENGC